MVDVTNPSNNLSYTEKDFQTIYPALLDLVKKLTLKWDPSISNESDPGVILLKLDAILGDKLDYNIDKNVLETFPASVTQLKNARQLYSQMGYEMKWYNAGTTKIGLAWKGERSEESEKTWYYKIPQFTMVSDDEDSIVFTLLDNNIQLAEDGTPFSANAIQGVVTDYTINDETLITAVNLDNEKKLHFVDYNVAENGIYICDAGNTSNDWLDTWKRVDNLNVEEFGQKIYRFGIDQAAGTCYIQFPDDIESLIGQGIYIKYILTNGSEGNIKAQLIDKLYHNISVLDPHNTENTVELNVDNIKVNNQASVDDGTDPEDIEGAYEGYKRTVGTFNTLVSLRDYFNYIVENNLVSNVIVCDRTNDPQTSYNIITSDGDIETTVNQRTTKIVIRDAKEGNTNLTVDCEEPSMEPFELKLYCLQNIKGFRDNSSYENSFLIDSIDPTLGTYGNVVADINSSETKHIQHDFDTLNPLTNHAFTVETKGDTQIAAGYMYFINSYPIVCKIIPTVELTKIQQTEVKSNVLQALRDAYNASKIEFGEEPDYQEIEKTIENADSRIKIAILNDFEYTLYAVYYDSKKGSEGIKTIKLSTKDADPTKDAINLDILAKSILAGVTPLFAKESDLTYLLNQSSIGKEEVGVLSTNVDIVLSNMTDKSNKYTLRDNESIVMYAPNLVDKTVYSTYTRFQYNIGVDVPANTSYELKENESIIFYWKESDEEEAYHYYLYSGTAKTKPVIKPSFSLKVSEWQDDGTYIPDGDISKRTYYTPKAFQLIPNSSGQTTANTVGTVQIIKSDTTQVAYTLTEYVANRMLADSLSGTKKIAIQELNKAEVKQSYYMYWITNNKEETKNADGTKTITYSIAFDENNEYLLKANEIFMYTDATISGIVSLGEGTKLVLMPVAGSSAPITWKLETPEIPISDLLNDGFTSDNSGSWARMVGALNPSVKNSVPGIVLTVIEQQLASASTKEQIQADPKFTGLNWEVIFSNDEHAYCGINTFSYNDKYLDDYFKVYPDRESADWPEIEGVNTVSQISPYYRAVNVNNFVLALDSDGQPIFSKNKNEILKPSNPDWIIQPYLFDSYKETIKWVPVTGPMVVPSGFPTRFFKRCTETEYNNASTQVNCFSSKKNGYQPIGQEMVEVNEKLVPKNFNAKKLRGYKFSAEEQYSLLIPEVSFSSNDLTTPTAEQTVGAATALVYPAGTVVRCVYVDAEVEKEEEATTGTTKVVSYWIVVEPVDISIYMPRKLSLRDFNITLAETKLNTVDISTATWDGFSVLSLNMGPEKPQELLLGQSIYWGEQAGSRIEGGNPSDIGNPFVISDQELVRYGGKNIDIHYYDADEKERTPILYWYRNTPISIVNDSAGLDNTITSYSTRIVLNIPDGSKGVYKITSKLPKGEYVLPIYSSADGVISNEGTTPGIVISATSFQKLSKNPPSSGGGHYYSLDYNGESEATVSIRVNNSTKKPQTIVIDNLIPYTDFKGDEVLKAVQTLDVDDVFNYAHIVDEDILIEDPTKPISFFDKNHIFNKYTIAKIDTSQFDKVTLSNRTLR